MTVADLDRFLLEHLQKGDQLLGKVLKSRYRPSEAAGKHGTYYTGNPVFTLLDERQLVFNVVVSQVKQLRNTSDKTVVIITGGPGTNKSVIAVHLLAALAAQNISVVHCTDRRPSRRATGAGWLVVCAVQAFQLVQRRCCKIDVLIADEAQDREASNSWFTKSKRNNKSQIEELIHAAQLSVFLLDDNQVVRPTDQASALIEQTAKLGIPVWKFNLNAQFRCAGSDAYRMARLHDGPRWLTIRRGSQRTTSSRSSHPQPSWNR